MNRRRVFDSGPLVALFLVSSGSVRLSAAPPIEKLLEHIPESAGAVLFTPSLEKLAARVAEFGRSSGIDELTKVTPERLIEDVVDVRVGLDTSGPFAIMLLTEDSDSPALVACLKDEAAWKKAAEAKPGEGAAADYLTLEWHGETAYAVAKDELLLIGSTIEELRSLIRPTSSAAERLKADGPRMETAHLVGYVSVSPWREMLAQGFDAFGGMLEMGMQMTAQNAQSSEQIAAMARFAVGETRAAVEQIRYVTMAANFAGEGLHLTGSCHFNKEAPQLLWLEQVKSGGRDPMRGLVDMPFMMAFGFDWSSGAGEASFTERMFKAMKESVPPDKREKFADGAKAAVEFQKVVTGGSGLMAMPQGATGMVMALNYFSPDPEKAAKLSIDNTEFGLAMATGVSGDLKMEIRKSEEKIGDRNVVMAELMAEGSDQRVIDAIKQVYGDRFGQAVAADKDGALIVGGALDALRPMLTKFLDRKEPELVANPRVVAARKRISPDPHFVAIADVGGLVDLINLSAKQQGQAMPNLRKPAGAVSLLIAGAYFAPRTMRGELFVPADTIKAGIKMVEDAEKPEGAAPAPM